MPYGLRPSGQSVGLVSIVKLKFRYLEFAFVGRSL
jgi:hypothetical protein